MRNFYLLTLAGFCLMLFGCKDDNPLKGYSKTENGLYYNLHTSEPGDKVKLGDRVSYHLKITNAADSVINDTRVNPGKVIDVNLPTNADVKQAPLLEAFPMMALNDSLTIAIEVDSLPQAPAGFTVGQSQIMFVNLALKGITSAEEVAKEQEAARAEAEAVVARAPEVEAMVAQTIKGYKNGSMKAQKTASGLEYIIHEEGTGPKPNAGAEVQVQYSGHLLSDGSKFDASFPRGTPIAFPLGQGRVIRGWDEGIALLNEGTKATLFIPANLGYGAQGSPPSIPGDAPLVFYVELVGVK